VRQPASSSTHVHTAGSPSRPLHLPPSSRCTADGGGVCVCTSVWGVYLDSSDQRAREPCWYRSRDERGGSSADSATTVSVERGVGVCVVVSFSSLFVLGWGWGVVGG
jgi:hypothetical protein